MENFTPANNCHSESNLHDNRTFHSSAFCVSLRQRATAIVLIIATCCIAVLLSFALIYKGFDGDSYISEQTYYTDNQDSSNVITDNAADNNSSSPVSFDDFVSAYHAFLDNKTTVSEEIFDNASTSVKDMIFSTLRTDGAAGGLIETEINMAIDDEAYDYDLTWNSFDSSADIFSDINLAEFLGIAVEARATQKDLEMLVLDSSRLKLLYNLSIETSYISQMEAGRIMPSYDSNGNWTNKSACEEKIKYGTVTLNRYSLHDLYDFFDISADDTNNDIFAYFSESSADTNNLELLDSIENSIRDMVSASGIDDIDVLGTNERTDYEYNSPAAVSNKMEIGSKFGDITGIAKVVGQSFLLINNEHPYGDGFQDPYSGHYFEYNYNVSIVTPWGSWHGLSPCCASGSTIVLKYYGLKAAVTHSTRSVVKNCGLKQVSVSSMSDLLVGDVLVYYDKKGAWQHTEIVTKIDGSSVYIAGYGDDDDIKADAEYGWNRKMNLSDSIRRLDFQGKTAVVLRPDTNSFNFSSK